MYGKFVDGDTILQSLFYQGHQKMKTYIFVKILNCLLDITMQPWLNCIKYQLKPCLSAILSSLG